MARPKKIRTTDCLICGDPLIHARDLCRKHYHAEYRQVNRVKIGQRHKKWCLENKAKVDVHRQKWLEQNKEARYAAIAQWSKKNKAARNAITARRRAKCRQASPQWLTEADFKLIKQVYKDALVRGYHVDHIVPLNGKLFSGLHVLHNLRPVPPEENLRKAAKLPPADQLTAQTPKTG